MIRQSIIIHYNTGLFTDLQFKAVQYYKLINGFIISSFPDEKKIYFQFLMQLKTDTVHTIKRY
ncbi:hypothetical protein ACFP3I_12245 [Chryseobacterium arachidis]|uniref:hypothetical protein n=1 Tax=Chryseobacterium arachidis TaxID=1416778 RepID=UPI000932D35D